MLTLNRVDSPGLYFAFMFTDAMLGNPIGGLKVNAKRKKQVTGNICIWFDITRIRVQLSRNIRLYGELNHDTKTEAITDRDLNPPRLIFTCKYC